MIDEKRLVLWAQEQRDIYFDAAVSNKTDAKTKAWAGAIESWINVLLIHTEDGHLSMESEDEFYAAIESIKRLYVVAPDIAIQKLRESFVELREGD